MSLMHAEVRQATRAQHEELERRLALSAETITLDGYRRFLQMTAAVVIPLEPSLASTLGDLFRVEGTSRAERLTRDLTALGLQHEGSSSIPMPDVSSHAGALGAAYVLQGSLLGGAVIARMLGERLGQSNAALSYLTLYGSDLGGAWRRFTTALDTFGATAPAAARAETVAAAISTFASFD